MPLTDAHFKLEQAGNGCRAIAMHTSAYQWARKDPQFKDGIKESMMIWFFPGGDETVIAAYLTDKGKGVWR